MVDATPAQTVTIGMMCKNKASGPYSYPAYVHLQAYGAGMSGKYWNFECGGTGYKPYTFSFKPSGTIKDLTVWIYINNSSDANKAAIDDVIVTVK